MAATLADIASMITILQFSLSTMKAIYYLYIHMPTNISSFFAELWLAVCASVSVDHLHTVESIHHTVTHMADSVANLHERFDDETGQNAEEMIHLGELVIGGVTNLQTRFITLDTTLNLNFTDLGNRIAEEAAATRRSLARRNTV